MTIREHTLCPHCHLMLVRSRGPREACRCLRCGASCYARPATFLEALSPIEVVREEYWHARRLLAGH